MRIKTAIVGSYPKPSYLVGSMSGREFLDSNYSFFEKKKKEVGQEELEKLLDQACEESITDQEEAGMDVITDGEERREHYIHYILKKLNGFDYKNIYEKVVKKLIDGQYRKTEKQYVPRVISEITYNNKILIDDFKFLRSKTKKEVKIGFPGPTTVIDAVRDEFYKDDKKLAFAYAKAINKEVKLLAAAGCEIIQSDDPGLLRNLERSKKWGIEALDSCFEGVDHITKIVHVCRSYPNKKLEKLGIIYKADEGYYPYLLDALQTSKIDQVSIEAKQENLNPKVLDHLGDKAVLLGCLDVGEEKVETVEEIIKQAKEALKYIKPEQLILSTDCGLLQISRKSARAKLANLAKAAKEL